MGWTSPISLIIFLARSSIHSHVRVALPPLLNRLLLPLFYLKTCDLVASNIRKPSMFLAFLIDWDTLLASTLWPHCSPRSKHLRYCLWLYLNLFLCTADHLSPQFLDGESMTFQDKRGTGFVFHVPVHTCAFGRQGGAEGMKISETIWRSRNLGTETV